MTSHIATPTTDTLTEDTTSRAGPRSSRRWWALAVISLAQLMVLLDATIVNIALPSAQADLGFSDDSRQWIVTAYALAFGSLLLLGGRIADLLGRTRMFLIGVVGFGAASALGGAANSFGLLVTARGLQGVFAALLAPAALSLLNTTFTEPGERAKAFGIFSAISGAGSGVGLLLGGVLTEKLDWRWCLYVNLAFAVAAFVGGLALLDRTRSSERAHLDVPGTITVSAGLFGLVYGVSNAQSHSWGSPLTWGFIAAGLVLLVAFVYLQTRVAHPLLPLRVVLDRNRAGSLLALLIVSIGIYGVFLFLTYYLQQTLGYSPIKTGLAFLPMVAGVATGAAVSASVLLPRLGARPLIPLGMALSAAGMIALTPLGVHASYPAAILPPLVIAGIGFGLVFGPGISTATYRINPADDGVGAAMVNTAQQVGASIGIAVLSTIAASAATNYLHDRQPSNSALTHAAVHSYAATYWTAAAFFAAAALACGALLRNGPPQADLDRRRDDEPSQGSENVEQTTRL